MFEPYLSACHIHPLGMGVEQHGHEWKPPTCGGCLR